MLNNWRENTRDAQREKKYLLGFREEIADNSRELKRIIKLNEGKNKRFSRHVRMIAQNTYPPDSAASILGEMMRNFLFMPKTDTYVSITASGNLNLISDFSLRRDLTVYYNKFKNIEIQEDVYMDYIHDYVIPFVYEHVDIGTQLLDAPETSRSRAFRNLVVGYSALLRMNLQLYQSMAELNEALQTRLDR